MTDYSRPPHKWQRCVDGTRFDLNRTVSSWKGDKHQELFLTVGGRFVLHTNSRDDYQGVYEPITNDDAAQWALRMRLLDLMADIDGDGPDTDQEIRHILDRAHSTVTKERCHEATVMGTRCLRRAQCDGWCWQHLKMNREVLRIMRESGVPSPVVYWTFA